MNFQSKLTIQVTAVSLLTVQYSTYKENYSEGNTTTTCMHAYLCQSAATQSK